MGNDTGNNAGPAGNFELSLSQGETLPSTLTFNENTGAVGVVQGAPSGIYTFDYDICELGNPNNCEAANNAAVTFFGPITMDLTGDPAILVPEGEVIEVVLSSHFGTNGRAEILMSVDGVNYTSLGTTGNGGSVYGAWQSNVLRYDDFTVPAGGARFLQVFQQASGVRADGVIYNTQCAESAGSPELTLAKAADDNTDRVVGDVITYTYTVTNNGNADINGIAINDTHNGSDPAPVPGSETLLTDTAPAGDSTDAATDGTWDVLAPGNAITFTGTYTVTQIDAENL